MSQLQLDIETVGKKENIFLIKPRGLIDIMTSPALDSCLEELIEQKRYNIIVDMAATSYISSAGWGIFIGSLRAIREHKGDIVFINLQEGIKDFFTTLNLPSKFKSFTDSPQAIAYFEKKNK